jgi:NAD-dependent deacetylase
LITQNIDNLDYRAGSQTIYEIHGNMFVTRCTKCSYSTRDFPLEPDELPPSCPNCSALLRPDIVLFGEMLPAQVITQSFRDAENCDMMLVIGTSGLVTPAANIPYIAKRSGAYLVEINIERTPLTRLMDKSFFGKAGDILPKIVELV